MCVKYVNVRNDRTLNISLTRSEVRPEVKEMIKHTDLLTHKIHSMSKELIFFYSVIIGTECLHTVFVLFQMDCTIRKFSIVTIRNYNDMLCNYKVTYKFRYSGYRIIVSYSDNNYMLNGFLRFFTSPRVLRSLYKNIRRNGSPFLLLSNLGLQELLYRRTSWTEIKGDW